MPNLSPVEWRFKKHKVEGVIYFRKKSNNYVFTLFHPSFKTFSSDQEDKYFNTLDEAKYAAEKWIELWYSIQGRILSFGAF